MYMITMALCGPYRILLVGVRSCHNYISSTIGTTASASTYVPKRWLSLCSSLLEQCWSLWDAADQTMRAKAVEEESLYCYKTKTHNIGGNEEGEEEESVRQVFPLYDCVFEEGGEGNKQIEGETEDGERGKKEEEGNTSGVCQFTCEEMEEVSCLHQLLFSQTTHFNSTLLTSKYSLAASLADIVCHIPGDTLRVLHIVLSEICCKMCSGLSTDYSLFGGHARMCKKLLTELSQEPLEKGRCIVIFECTYIIYTHVYVVLAFDLWLLLYNSCSNVYKEAVVCEAKRAGPVVTDLKNRVEKLLVEWPEHPGLVQVTLHNNRLVGPTIN